MTEALTTYKGIDAYSDVQIRAYKRQLGVKNESPDEWEMLKILSNMYQLDPFARQIWLVPGVGVFVGHAGFLQLAHRSGKFAGMETYSYNMDGTPYRGEGSPTYATCNVWILGSGKPITKTVYFGEFYRTGKDGKKTNWDKMPGYMLEKVAEVHALKRAFSIGGIYSPEEMGYDEEEMLPKSGYTGTVDGEPVNVEPLKRTETPQKTHSCEPETHTCDTPKCTKCGGELMDRYESDQMQNAWDEHRWGTVPPGLCKACVNEYWRAHIKDKSPITPTTPGQDPEPAGNPEAVKAFVESIPPLAKDKPKTNPTLTQNSNSDLTPQKKPAAIVTVFGQQYPAVCCKCGVAVDPIGFIAKATFVGNQVYCKECNAEVGVDRV